MAKNKPEPMEELQQKPAPLTIPYEMVPEARIHAPGKLIPLLVMARVTPDGLVIDSAKRM